MNSNKIMVSICMITYNHEAYLKKAIESVLNQKTSFNFELIIANDNSPDKTTFIVNDIIKNHEKGNFIRFLNNKQNIGMMPNFVNALNSCRGKYIALCEGDDYWTNEYKLQIQFDFLEKNPDYAITFHKADIEQEGNIIKDNITTEPKQTTTILDLAKGNYMHTCTVMYRNNLFPEFPENFLNSPIGDYYLHMLNSRFGKIYYMKKNMAVYRIHDTSYWSSKKQDERVKIWIEFIESIKPNFNTKVKKRLNKQIKKTQPRIKLKNKIKELFYSFSLKLTNLFYKKEKNV